MSIESVGVMIDGSIIGLGRCGDELAGVSSTSEAHCFGRPTNLLEWLSNPVWTRCWKLDGAEMSIFFFFLENIFTLRLKEIKKTVNFRIIKLQTWKVIHFVMDGFIETIIHRKSLFFAILAD